MNLGACQPSVSAEIRPSRGTEEVRISITLNVSDRSFMNENLVSISSRKANCHDLDCDASQSSFGLVGLNVTEHIRTDHAIRPRLTKV